MILDSFIYWAFLLQQIYVEHISIINIRTNRVVLSMLVVVFVFLMFFFGFLHYEEFFLYTVKRSVILRRIFFYTSAA